MTKGILLNMMERLPYGCACANLLYNAAGDPEDGLITEANAAFFSMLSAPCKIPTAISSLRVSECLKDFLPGGAQSTMFYRELKEKQSAQIDRVQVTGGDDWVYVDAFVIDEESFTLTIRTEEKTQDEDAGKASKRNAENVEADFIFNSTQDAMFIAEYTDGEFRYLRLNSAHRKLSGLQSTTIQGKTPVDVWGGNDRFKTSCVLPKRRQLAGRYYSGRRVDDARENVSFYDESYACPARRPQISHRFTKRYYAIQRTAKEKYRTIAPSAGDVQRPYRLHADY